MLCGSNSKTEKPVSALVPNEMLLKEYSHGEGQTMHDGKRFSKPQSKPSKKTKTNIDLFNI